MTDNIRDKQDEAEDNNKSAEKPALKEYELAVKTQMHFNEILMKFRSVGLAVVIAVYSYAITRKDLGISLGSSLSPAQWIAIAGVALACVLALIDVGYFFRLLIGAVARSTELEKEVPYRLTSTISAHVSSKCSYALIIVFYGLIGIGGIGLAAFVLPQGELQNQRVSIDGPSEVKIDSATAQIHRRPCCVATRPSATSQSR